MLTWLSDPGDCIICGAPHCGCTGGPLVVETRPATAAARARATTPKQDALQATLGPGQFTTATYRRVGRPAAPRPPTSVAPPPTKT